MNEKWKEKKSPYQRKAERDLVTYLLTYSPKEMKFHLAYGLSAKENPITFNSAKSLINLPPSCSAIYLFPTSPQAISRSYVIFSFFVFRPLAIVPFFSKRGTISDTAYFYKAERDLPCPMSVATYNDLTQIFTMRVDPIQTEVAIEKEKERFSMLRQEI